MVEWLENHFLWLKVFHIISIIAWMAGLFYFPRLLVYHTQRKDNPEIHALFQIMEKKLYRIIMCPAMFFSLTTGFLLATIGGMWTSGSLHVKLAAVLALTVFHFLLNRWRYEIQQETCKHSERFFRIINEIPTLLLVVIVTCVVIKPF